MGKSYLNNIKSIEKSSYVEKKLNYEELIAENIRLRNILDIKEKNRYFSRFVVSNIVSVKPPVFPVEIVINKGLTEGIREGMCVVSKDLFLIGRVSEVNKNTANVVTIFNSTSKISIIVDSTKEVGIMEGGSIPYCILKYISYESKIRIGDRIFTSGYSDFYPKGIEVGEVVKISKAGDSLFLSVYVKPYSCLSYIDEVMVGE